MGFWGKCVNCFKNGISKMFCRILSLTKWASGYARMFISFYQRYANIQSNHQIITTALAYSTFLGICQGTLPRDVQKLKQTKGREFFVSLSLYPCLCDSPASCIQSAGGWVCLHSGNSVPLLWWSLWVLSPFAVWWHRTAWREARQHTPLFWKRTQGLGWKVGERKRRHKKK